jgi:hypothetical protein
MSTDYLFSFSAVSCKAVSTVLDRLGYSTAPSEASDLYSLMLVDEFLQDPTFPRTLQDRQYAIATILITYISERLCRLASYFDLTPPLANETYREAMVTIERYASTHNPELIGWCWLYYHYVRTELDIQAKLFSSVCFLSQRTLQRYHRYAIKRLTEMLIQAEWQLRQQRHNITTLEGRVG